MHVWHLLLVMWLVNLVATKYDLDAMGVVHNGRYAVLLERALAAFWGRAGCGAIGFALSSPCVRSEWPIW